MTRIKSSTVTLRGIRDASLGLTLLLLPACTSTQQKQPNFTDQILLSSADIRSQILNRTVSFSINVRGVGNVKIQHFYEGKSLTYQHKTKSSSKTELTSGTIRLVDGKGLCKSETSGKRSKEICWNFAVKNGKYFVIPNGKKPIRISASVTEGKAF